jgi:hypothetical protein
MSAEPIRQLAHDMPKESKQKISDFLDEPYTAGSEVMISYDDFFEWNVTYR